MFFFVLKDTFGVGQECVNRGMIHKGHSNVVSSAKGPLVESFFGIRKEQDVSLAWPLGTDIKQPTVGCGPKRVELCFDKEAGEFQDAPPVQDFPALVCDLQSDIRKAIVLEGARMR